VITGNQSMWLTKKNGASGPDLNLPNHFKSDEWDRNQYILTDNKKKREYGTSQILWHIRGGSRHFHKRGWWCRKKDCITISQALDVWASFFYKVEFHTFSGVSVDTYSNKAKIFNTNMFNTFIYGGKCLIHVFKGENKFSEIQLCGKGGVGVNREKGSPDVECLCIDCTKKKQKIPTVPDLGKMRPCAS